MEWSWKESDPDTKVYQKKKMFQKVEKWNGLWTRGGVHVKDIRVGRNGAPLLVITWVI